jgi:hypothetical protein
MFGSQVLDVAIGLVLIFCLLSLVLSTLRELIETGLKTRAVHLQRGIQQLVSDWNNNDLTTALYKHPMIASLYKDDYQSVAGKTFDGKNMPSYIPSANFVGALMDLVLNDPKAPKDSSGTAYPLSITSLRAAAEKLDNEAVKRAVIVAIDGARGDIAKAQANLEAWFNASMDRVSGWYRKHTQAWLLGLSLLLCGIGNINTIAFANHIWRSKAAQDLIVQTAATVVHDTTYRTTTPSDSTSTAAYATFQSLNLPMGWNQPATERLAIVPTVLGILLTTIALTLGAPFWFDLLSKLMQIRTSVKPKNPAK